MVFVSAGVHIQAFTNFRHCSVSPLLSLCDSFFTGTSAEFMEVIMV